MAQPRSAVTWRLAIVLALSLPAPGMAAYEEGRSRTGDVISGTVKFVGTAPKLEPIAVNKNRDVCGDRKPSEALVVGPERRRQGQRRARSRA